LRNGSPALSRRADRDEADVVLRAFLIPTQTGALDCRILMEADDASEHQQRKPGAQTPFLSISIITPWLNFEKNVERVIISLIFPAKRLK
jgi:hypothetical protein